MSRIGLQLMLKGEKKRKNITKSKLDNILGVGKILKSRLLIKFKNIKNIEKASIDDLMTVKGINEKIAILIKNELK